ncbi:MAG: 16S rRNA (cytidine(1402)-2'-O)-methyltransferase [uncultured Acidimicrobiales bacterium]|uniref:Ribosomal RNA small subunit methyltransferase I n=1 Tax=uncultured Acidimicrobiales bacterium TaxID=310071 RepID=A0A6J4JJ26_9ACTN|nr:MAG: 16S rRNA (cytidine(1402)-2'-O)-methyltransferase [uncultured Acidimicrobiales bacterium]
MTAALILVGTPIGNLGDLTPRAVDALATADTIACEDTRRTRALLSHLGLPAGKRLLAVHDHNEAVEVANVLARLDKGERVVVVTDAGMPGISDPGERLVAAAAAANHQIEVVPGPSALIAALVVSGLSTSRFCFEGFLPRKGTARARRVAEVAADLRTTVVFEAPHRVRQTVGDLAGAAGDTRRVALARELTKMHEEVWRGTLGGAIEHLSTKEPRGEYVVVLDGAPPPQPAGETDVEAALRARLDAGTDKRSAITEVTATLGVPKRVVYDVALRISQRG